MENNEIPLSRQKKKKKNTCDDCMIKKVREGEGIKKKIVVKSEKVGGYKKESDALVYKIKRMVSFLFLFSHVFYSFDE